MKFLTRLLVVVFAFGVNGVYAQAWPAKQITIVVPFAPVN
jgi:tripartite-type tricarboxylate transporter receptor subunit TctC